MTDTKLREAARAVVAHGEWGPTTLQLDALRAALDEPPEQRGEYTIDLEALPGHDRAWPLVDVLRRLKRATRHGFNHHKCDCHGWEGDGTAADEAAHYIALLDPQPTAPPEQAPEPAVSTDAKPTTIVDRWALEAVLAYAEKPQTPPCEDDCDVCEAAPLLRAALDEPPEAPVDRERVFDLEHAISQHLDATGECKGDGDDPSLWLCRSPECTYCELARALDPDKCGTPLAPRPSTCACGHPASDHGLDMSFNEPCRRCECCDYGDATEPPEQAPEPTEGVCMKCGSKSYPDVLLVGRAEWERLRDSLTARAQGEAAGVDEVMGMNVPFRIASVGGEKVHMTVRELIAQGNLSTTEEQAHRGLPDAS